jgi:hypothetical protein
MLLAVFATKLTPLRSVFDDYTSIVACAAVFADNQHHIDSITSHNSRTAIPKTVAIETRKKV